MKIPCGPNCKDRNLTCHDYCPRYLKYRLAVEESKARKREESEYLGYVLGAVNRMQSKRKSY